MMIRLMPIRVHWVWLALLLIGGGLAAGCDTTPGTAPPERQVVVESYLIAQEPLPPIRLSRTAPIEGQYDFTELAIRDAEVTVERLGADGDVAESYPYAEVPDSAGVYRPEAEAQVQPLATYRLQVRTPESAAEAAQTVTATTVVPDTFSVVRVENDPVVYQGEEQIAFALTKSAYPTRDQAFYLLTTEALELDEDQLTPLAAEFFENGSATLDDLRLTSSPVLNEASYTQNPDGTLTVRLPWIAVTFYGPNRSTTNAIDDNLYDFVRSQNAQQGGGGFSPGAIPNVIEHVDGGTGVFGSLARQSRTIRILRPSGASSSSE